MSVRFFYVDESYDSQLFCLSAISIRHAEWNACFDLVRDHREGLKRDFGIYLRKEIHANELVSGHGRYSVSVLGKYRRSQVFLGLLDLITRLPSVFVVNVAIPVRGYSDPELTAWDRLTNRMERTLRGFQEKELRIREDLVEGLSGIDGAEEVAIRLRAFKSCGLIVADEGRQLEVTKILRKMRVYNPVPSAFGSWASGEPTRNITTQHLIEDPVFKPSHRSYFIQLADCAAFALLKRETAPTPRIKKYRIDRMWDQTIRRVAFRQASRGDPDGIVRR